MFNGGFNVQTYKLLSIFIITLLLGSTSGAVFASQDVGTISTYSQCACGLQGDYLYHTATFLNYCPHCHRYGSLHYTHNEGSVEGRLTCGDGYGNGGCDADYCAVDGKEEVYHGALWLTKASARVQKTTVPSSSKMEQVQPAPVTLNPLQLLQLKLGSKWSLF